MYPPIGLELGISDRSNGMASRGKRQGGMLIDQSDMTMTAKENTCKASSSHPVSANDGRRCKFKQGANRFGLEWNQPWHTLKA